MKSLPSDVMKNVAESSKTSSGQRRGGALSTVVAFRHLVGALLLQEADGEGQFHCCP